MVNNVTNKFYKFLTPKLLILMLLLDVLMFLMLGFMLNTYFLINNEFDINKISFEYFNNYFFILCIITIVIHFVFSYILIKKIM